MVLYAYHHEHSEDHGQLAQCSHAVAPPNCEHNHERVSAEA
jgi:hypothetical protein